MVQMIMNIIKKIKFTRIKRINKKVIKFEFSESERMNFKKIYVQISILRER